MAKKAGKKVNKSEWVRSQPATMSAKDVVTKAKDAGISITDKYVHTIRYNAKSGKKKAGRPAGAGAVRRGPGRPKGSGKLKVHAVGAHHAEDLLKAVAAEIGLVRAIGILTSEHDRVHRLLGG
jgi:hypothetical protein